MKTAKGSKSISLCHSFLVILTCSYIHTSDQECREVIFQTELPPSEIKYLDFVEKTCTERENESYAKKIIPFTVLTQKCKQT